MLNIGAITVWIRKVHVHFFFFFVRNRMYHIMRMGVFLSGEAYTGSGESTLRIRCVCEIARCAVRGNIAADESCCHASEGRYGADIYVEEREDSSPQFHMSWRSDTRSTRRLRWKSRSLPLSTEDCGNGRTRSSFKLRAGPRSSLAIQLLTNLMSGMVELFNETFQQP